MVENDAKGGVKEVRKFLIFRVKGAKQEAGSVVTKLENRFPNLRTRISPGCLSGKTTFCNKVSYSIVCKNCISFFSAGIGAEYMGINSALTMQLHETNHRLFSDSGNCEQYFMESGMVLS